MLKGNIFVTYNPNVVVNQAINITSNILFMTEEDDIDPELFRICNSGRRATFIGCLLPDPASFTAMVEGSPQDFENEYFRYLSSPVCTELIAVLLKAMYLGKNLFIYCQQEHAATYINHFMKFMGLQYGLIIGTIDTDVPNRDCAFDARYVPKIIEILYMYGLFNVMELMTECPQGYHFTNNTVIKLTNEVNPYINKPNPVLEDYERYFFEYKERIKGNNNKFLKTFVHRG